MQEMERGAPVSERERSVKIEEEERERVAPLVLEERERTLRLRRQA